MPTRNKPRVDFETYEATSKERDLLHLAVHDLLFGDPKEASCGKIRVRTSAGECEPKSEAMEARVMRAMGSMPYVIVTVPKINHVEVTNIEPWVWQTTGSLTLRILRERVRLAHMAAIKIAEV